MLGEPVLETGAGIADAVSSRVRKERIVGQAQFEILVDPKLQQSVDVLLRSGRIQAPFGFEHSGLHRLCWSGNRGAVRDSREFILRKSKTAGREKKNENA